MMTASKGMSAGALENYHGEGKEDYYTKDGGTWLGTGAEALGLTGPVNKNDFRAICAGLDPNDLTKTLVSGKIEGGEEKRRAGNDLSFSAPKSMSVAIAAGDEKMQNIHNTAVANVMAYIEEHYSHARTPGGYQSTGNIVAAKFDHATNRNLEPNIHSHVVLANITRTNDGKWRANDPKSIYQDQKSLGQLYRNELVRELQNEGYGVDIINRGETIFEVRGVDQKLIDQFSSRRAEVEATVKEWKEAGMHSGLTEPQLHEKAALESRQGKHKDLTQEGIKLVWEKGFQEAGTTKTEVLAAIAAEKELAKPVSPIQFAGQEKAGTDSVQKSEVGIPAGKLSAEEVINVAIKAAHATDTTFGRTAVIANAVKFDTGNHSLAALNKTFSDMQERSAITKLDEQKGVEKFSTIQMIDTEKSNIEKINALEGTYKPVTDRAEISSYIQKWEQEKGFSLSAHQKQAIEKELTGTHGALAIQGDPGTGKTTIAEVVEKFNTDVLKLSGRNNHVIGVAFTGKAAQELSDTLGRNAATVDSFLNSDIKVVSKEEYAKIQKTEELAKVHQPQEQNLDAVSIIENGKHAETVGNKTFNFDAKGNVTGYSVKGNDGKVKLNFDSKGTLLSHTLYVSSGDATIARTFHRDGSETTQNMIRTANGSLVVQGPTKNNAEGKSIDGMNSGGKNITYIPEGSNVTLKLDEASLVGAVQKGQLLDRLAEIQKAIGSEHSVKLTEYGDFKQKQAIAAGPTFGGQVQERSTADRVDLKEINRQKDKDLLNVAIQFNSGDTKDAQTAFDGLSTRGNVTEIKDKEVLH